MSSVVSETTCPHCGRQHAMSDYNYRTDEESIFCYDCGYSYQKIAVLEEKSNKFQMVSIAKYKYSDIYIGLFDHQQKLIAKATVIERKGFEVWNRYISHKEEFFQRYPLLVQAAFDSVHLESDVQSHICNSVMWAPY